VDPILSDHSAAEIYEPGTWGPESAQSILAGDANWHDPQPEESTPC
jgi:glucose-6-phosphate 1-dehydrogenase